MRDQDAETIEAIGIERALAEFSKADVILWLGSEGEGPPNGWEITARIDTVDCLPKNTPRHRVSALTGEGLEGLRHDLVGAARVEMPKPGDAALNARQSLRLSEARAGLEAAMRRTDLLLIAEELRQTRLAFDRLIGRATTEDMLDSLFGRFCIGK